MKQLIQMPKEHLKVLKCQQTRLQNSWFLHRGRERGDGRHAAWVKLRKTWPVILDPRWLILHLAVWEKAFLIRLHYQANVVIYYLPNLIKYLRRFQMVVLWLLSDLWWKCWTWLNSHQTGQSPLRNNLIRWGIHTDTCFWRWSVCQLLINLLYAWLIFNRIFFLL